MFQISSIFGHKPRDTAELVKHPDFIYRAWQLQGSATMVGHWLLQQEDPVAKEFGKRLLGVTSWFVEEQSDWGKAPQEPT